MRLATIVPLALAVVVGFAPAALACPVDTVTGPISEVVNSIGSLLGLTSPAPSTQTATPQADETCTACTACGATPTGAGSTGTGSTGTCSKSAKGSTPSSTVGGMVTNNFTTNNVTTNNFFSTPAGTAAGGATGGATTASGTAGATPIALAGGALGAGGGGGGVGGGGSIGGFSGGGGGISGMPINPSSDFSYPMVAGGGGGNGGGSGFAEAGGVMLASAQTPDVGFGSATAASDEPLTAGVALAALPGAQGGGEAYVGMASPKMASATGTPASGFGFEGPAAADGGPPAPTPYGGLMLAGLVGVGVVGAGLAWKSLAV